MSSSTPYAGDATPPASAKCTGGEGVHLCMHHACMYVKKTQSTRMRCARVLIEPARTEKAKMPAGRPGAPGTAAPQAVLGSAYA